MKYFSSQKILSLLIMGNSLFFYGCDYIRKDEVAKNKEICVEYKTEGWLSEDMGELCNTNSSHIRCMTTKICDVPEKKIVCGLASKNDKTLEEISNNKCKCYVYSGQFPDWQCEK